MSEVKRVLVIILLGLLLAGTTISASALYTTGPINGSKDITMYGDSMVDGKMTPAGDTKIKNQTLVDIVDQDVGCAPVAAAPLAAPVACGPIAAPVPVPAVPVVSGGFTRTYTSNCAGGTFIPPQMEVTQSFYSHPGISPYGPYPGAGIASGFGVGLTPMGYGAYGGTIPLI